MTPGPPAPSTVASASVRWRSNTPTGAIGSRLSRPAWAGAVCAPPDGARPSATRARRARTTIMAVTPAASPISASLQAGPCVPWSHRSQIRALRRALILGLPCPVEASCADGPVPPETVRRSIVGHGRSRWSAIQGEARRIPVAIPVYDNPCCQGKRKVARDGRIGPVLGVVCDRQVGCRPWILASALP